MKLKLKQAVPQRWSSVCDVLDRLLRVWEPADIAYYQRTKVRTAAITLLRATGVYPRLDGRR